MDIKTLHLQVNMMFYQHTVILMEAKFWTYTEDIIARTVLLIYIHYIHVHADLYW